MGGGGGENFHIKSIIRSRVFTPTTLMKNVQRHIHYFIELSECDKRRAAATEGMEAALQRSLRPLSEDMAIPATRGGFVFALCLYSYKRSRVPRTECMRQSSLRPICPLI